MNPKALKITYWIVTGLFSAFMLMAGITEFIQHESGKEIMRHLGYPYHVLTVLGIGKTLGAIALMQQKFKTIKEWAYAGYTFNFLGAFAARLSAGDSFGLVISPWIFLAVLFLSYFLWKKMEQLKISKNS
jgi:uncharacterized membrane protein